MDEEGYIFFSFGFALLGGTGRVVAKRLMFAVPQRERKSKQASKPNRLISSHPQSPSHLNKRSISAKRAVFPALDLFPPFSRKAVIINFLFSA